MKQTLLASALLLASFGVAFADQNQDWEKIQQLDAGPQSKFESREAARSATLAHLSVQEKAYRDYIARYPSDPHALDAELRLVHLLAVRSDLEATPKYFEQARTMADAILKRPQLTPEQRANAAFVRLSLAMLHLDPSHQADRDAFLSDVRRFERQFPEDRRVSRVLVKAADLYDSEPERKRELLQDAQKHVADEETRSEIADDLKQIDQLGKQLPIEFTALDGSKVDIASFKGKPVIVLFFADWSPPSMQRVQEVQGIVNRAKAASVAVIGISLDRDRATLEKRVREMNLNWPVAFDGKGWESPLVRSLGVNTLPTTWLFDRQGRLRTLNARQELSARLQDVLRE